VALRESLRTEHPTVDGPTRLRTWAPIWQSPARSAGDEASAPAFAYGLLRYVPLSAQCNPPRALAADGAHLRLFVACDDAKLLVTDAQTGQLIESLPTGPGADDVGYDPNQRLIFAANGGDAGSLTIIHQDNTDSYHVVQNLPTSHRARTLAVDETSGWVYLVTHFWASIPSMR